MMATKVYVSANIELIDGTELYITPLKLRYLREFMESFDHIKDAETDDEALIHIADCVRIAFKQYYPNIATIYDVEDSVDLKTMYKVLEIAGGISMKANNEKPIAENAKDGEATWEGFDLARLESEVFLLGIWKDYEELELSLSLPELTAILDAKRESDYQDRKFLAAIQGIDLDEQTGKKEENAWEKLKAEVFSGGKTSDPNDIVSFQGSKAAKAGFGIGMGIGYEKID